jgi:hypothetical protein
MLSAQIGKSSNPYNFCDSENIIACALRIDNELANWAATCPSDYYYRTVTLEERSEDVYSDFYHVYNSISAATMWNDYRVIRILVNELLLQHLREIIQEKPESTETGNSSWFFYQLI